MKKVEIKDLTTKELIEKIQDEKLMLTKMKLNHHINPLDNPMKIRQTRRTIARLMSELRKRQLNENIK
ncbi:MAG: 50S ribosomal protein L29 [Bacteroidales bacterium]|jgi:large subunit ribosomal protein L29|nr:50S ribosomal protein L29 [Bacteroidales bacterium]HPC26898.1 50S ribosomal protein L29 [Paludibacteraceae bacterium]